MGATKPIGAKLTKIIFSYVFWGVESEFRCYFDKKGVVLGIWGHMPPKQGVMCPVLKLFNVTYLQILFFNNKKSLVIKFIMTFVCASGCNLLSRITLPQTPVGGTEKDHIESL